MPTRHASRRGETALVGLLLLLLLAPASVADEREASPAPVTPPLVIEAHQRGDTAALRRMAASAEQGVWFLAENLGQEPDGHAAALALAKAWGDPDQAALVRYVVSRKGKRHADDAMRALVEARGAMDTGRPSAAKLMLDSTSFEAETVLGMWVLDVRAQVLVRLDRSDESLQLYLAAADVAERLGWRAHAADLLRRASRLAAAERDYTAEHAALERRYNLLRSRGEDGLAATCRGNLASASAKLEDFGSARRLFAEAVRDLRAAGRLRHAALARANLGLLHADLGEYERALTQLETALGELEREGNVPDRAETLSLLAEVRRDLGQTELALELHGTAVGLMRAYAKEPGTLTRESRFTLAVVVGNLGNTHLVAGNYKEAREYLLEALDIFETQLKYSHGVALALGNLAELAFRQGDLVGANARVQASLGHLEKLGAESDMIEPRLMAGRILVARGEHAAAELEFAAAQAVAERLRAYDQVVAAMTERAELALLRGKLDDASDLAFGGVDLLGGSLAHLADAEGADARQIRLRTYQMPIRVAVALDDAEACAEAIDLSRAGTFLEAMGGRAALRAHALTPDLRARIDRARAEEDRAWSNHRRAERSQSRSRRKSAKHRLDAARKKTESILQSIQRAARHGADLVYPRADELAEVQATLGPADALVLYALLPKASVALVVTKTEKHIRRLADEGELRKACDALLQEDAPFVKPAGVDALVKALIKPLELPAAVTRVLISPDGILTYVPFSMLLPKQAIAYVPSGTAYRALYSGGVVQGTGVVALGDPAYGVHKDERRLALYRGSFGGTLPRLKASGDEARAVGAGGTVLTGKDATEANLRRAVKPRRKRKRLRVLHIAGHGMADAERPQLSCIALTPSGDDDGYLLAREVMGLQIPADLVVLSACASVRGKVVRAEGLQGLTRAFMFAGASRVLASLWRVDDEATKAFMLKFYGLWRPKTGAGLPAAEALRQTQEHMRTKTKWSGPEHWAAWVLWGLPG